MATTVGLIVATGRSEGGGIHVFHCFACCLSLGLLLLLLLFLLRMGSG